MELKGSVALFQFFEDRVTFTDVATGYTIKHKSIKGKIDLSASVQNGVAAIAMTQPTGVFVMKLETAEVTFKFKTLDGLSVTVTLNRDASILVLATEPGLFFVGFPLLLLLFLPLLLHVSCFKLLSLLLLLLFLLLLLHLLVFIPLSGHCAS
jgi:hypothetical protein